MNNKPLVSSITIFLNAETFIEEAIESVFAQTYDHWELLLVDDGSTDGSTAIALRYAQQYPDKVCYLEHEEHQNHGMSAARNLGIYHAKGEYIAFLDADDVWLPHKLEQQVAILESQPEAVMTYGPTQMWYGWTGNRRDIRRDYKRNLGVQPNTLVKPPTLLALFLRGKAETPGICGVLVRRKAVEALGWFEEVFRGIYEDQAFFAKVCLKAPVFVSSGCWDRYRQHSDNCCSVAQKAGEYHSELPHPAYLTFLSWLAEYLSQQEVKNPEVWQALQKAIWPYHHPKLYRLLRPLYPIKLIARQILPVPIRYWLRTLNRKATYRQV